jgi:signal transduction histidine kinase
VDTVQNAVELPIDIDYRWDEELDLVSDRVLLRRVVTNMLKNAAEASGGQTVHIRTARQGDGIAIEVRNSGYMSREVQLQLFKRSFSTKGEGRGYGTYGMKLFGERYLKGKIRFVSTPESGTAFTFLLPLEWN